MNNWFGLDFGEMLMFIKASTLEQSLYYYRRCKPKTFTKSEKLRSASLCSNVDFSNPPDPTLPEAALFFVKFVLLRNFQCEIECAIEFPIFHEILYTNVTGMCQIYMNLLYYPIEL